jgi:hypothetical protein
MNAATPDRPFTKHFTTSILLWMRTDQPRQAGMDHWRGPHSGIIAATPGLLEYRQVHLEEENPGLWPALPGVETRIPVERKVDEINVFRRTLLYAGPPGSSRCYDVGDGPVGVPWNEHTWDTPHVAHDNPKEHRLHGSLILGFTDSAARQTFFERTARALAPLIVGRLAALHAYNVMATPTFVQNGQVLTEPRR